MLASADGPGSRGEGRRLQANAATEATTARPAVAPHIEAGDGHPPAIAFHIEAGSCVSRVGLARRASGLLLSEGVLARKSILLALQVGGEDEDNEQAGVGRAEDDGIDLRQEKQERHHRDDRQGQRLPVDERAPGRVEARCREQYDQQGGRDAGVESGLEFEVVRVFQSLISKSRA